VLETIQNPVLAEAQTALGKHVLWNVGICLIVEILRKKTASPCKIALKSGNWLLSYDQDKIVNMARVRHLEFKKNSYLVT